MHEPLKGRTVVLVHPAWHSCGSHQVFVTQAEAYASLGARVLALAVNDMPARRNSRQKQDYFDRSRDLLAHRREWLAMLPASVLDRHFANALARRLRGDVATLRLEVARRTALPRDLGAIDLIHCNHFFNMPVAHLVAAGSNAPIVLESHDIQARQYDLGNKSGWTFPPQVSFEELLTIELGVMKQADLLVHLNNDESRSFRAALPSARHALIYPAVTSTPLAGAGRDLLIVAAANQANFLSVTWFLEQVVPLAPDLPYRIVGTIGAEMQRRAPNLFDKYRSMFADRVDDIGASYRAAAAVLLPTIAGHGISIKTIEALSCGAPLVATPHAFRGMNIDATALSNVSVAIDPSRFASLIRAVALIGSRPDPASADTRRLYERMFSPSAYRQALGALIVPLLEHGSIGHDAEA